MVSSCAELPGELGSSSVSVSVAVLGMVVKVLRQMSKRRLMESFSRFLEGMGYPQARLRHPGDGRRSHSPYEDSTQIAGLIGWYYEQEGMMPMLVGHSQGGIQLVKVLHELAGNAGAPIPVWNPKTDAAQDRVTIFDPYTGAERPVVGLRIGYASVVGAGGAALLLPNQWSMAGRLRSIPDSVDDFTGFVLGVDLIAWDLPGVGATYRAQGSAQVRNVELPTDYSHVFVVATSALARDPAMREWLNAYVPGRTAELPANARSTENSLWAAVALNGLTAVALSAGDGRRAALLAGAAEALCEEAGTPLEAWEQSLRDRNAAALRSALDAAMPLLFHIVASSRGASEYERWP